MKQFVQELQHRSGIGDDEIVIAENGNVHLFPRDPTRRLEQFTGQEKVAIKDVADKHGYRTIIKGPSIVIHTGFDGPSGTWLEVASDFDFR